MSTDNTIDLGDLSRRIAEDDGDLHVPQSEADDAVQAPLDDAFAGIREKLQADTERELEQDEAVVVDAVDAEDDDATPMVEATASVPDDAEGFGADTVWNGVADEMEPGAEEVEAHDFQAEMPDLAATAESSVAALFAAGVAAPHDSVENETTTVVEDTSVEAETMDASEAELAADADHGVVEDTHLPASEEPGTFLDDDTPENVDLDVEHVTEIATEETLVSASTEAEPKDAHSEELARNDDQPEVSHPETTQLADDGAEQVVLVDEANASDNTEPTEGTDEVLSAEEAEDVSSTPLVLSPSMAAVNAIADDDLPSIATNTPEAFPDGMAFDPDQRRPRICLMGEFSAGKSTLSNLLLGARSLPVNVTATQLPPVWISYGDRSPYRVDLDGLESPVDLNKIEDIPVEETSHIRIFRRADILEICDLIDMPGISDPNMSAEVWQRMLPEADAVIWCTHATQAWRQSEAAVWSMMDPALQKKSLLLLTRMDKILTERDQMRVMRRVGKETTGLFRAQFGVSLLKALEAGEDEAAWTDSGAEDFVVELVGLIREIAQDISDPLQRASEEAQAVSTSLTQRPRPVAQLSDGGMTAPTPQQNVDAAEGLRVSPQRIRPKAVTIDPRRRSSRPSPGSDAGL